MKFRIACKYLDGRRIEFLSFSEYLCALHAHCDGVKKTVLIEFGSDNVETAVIDFA